ncbi:hypothetical protein MJO28_003697 [Puccinia striiformis f. sp. tritici]|uniref:Uncharacterized protein n=2 Tax=Puccinia striiformis TaxID=27350 RepID=A0A2S4UKY2_9BASI|nr:hypothetical protein MJO28_003697 [Puccinia striiformis f. sp. tritici]POV97871.1 hypothetical protein PSTT_14783 [Puccinia striiformis]
MPDLIFLDSNDFFINRPDKLEFLGQFTGESGPHLRARPNEGPLDLNRMSAEGHSNESNQMIPLVVNMTVPNKADFAVETGKSYSVEGELIRLEGEDTITFHIERGVNNRAIEGPELVDLGPIRVSGIGTIHKVLFVYRNADQSLWQLDVEHEHRGAQEDSIRVRYLIPVEDLDVPFNTVFCLGSRIYLGGHIVSLGFGEAVMTVQVTAGAYFEQGCRESF